jgi:hypothetical protein
MIEQTWGRRILLAYTILKVTEVDPPLPKKTGSLLESNMELQSLISMGTGEYLRRLS